MRRLAPLFLSLSFVLVIGACQKEIEFDPANPANPNPPAGATGSLKAKIDGSQWVANKVASAARMNGLINITGYSSDRKILTITLTDSGVHRYTLADVTINAAALVDSNDTNPFAFASNQGTFPTTSGGEVNVTAIDTAKKTISGTFSFKVYRDIDNKGKTITEGSFTNIPYTTTLPATPATDSFRVKIDGAAWQPASVTAFSLSMLNQIVVNATDAAGVKAVGLVMPNNITAGTYTFGFFGTYIGQYNPDSDPMHSKMSASGTLTILEHNTATKRIRGNFDFIGKELATPANVANISEGYFSVRYQ